MPVKSVSSHTARPKSASRWDSFVAHVTPRLVERRAFRGKVRPGEGCH
jgi:hypothetical protein